MSSKTKNILNWVVAGLLAFMFAGAGIGKFAMGEAVVQQFAAWGYPAWFVYVVGIGEILLAAVILVPKTRRLGIFLTWGWALGAILTHVFAAELEQIIGPLVFAVVATILFLLGRAKAKSTPQTA